MRAFAGVIAVVLLAACGTHPEDCGGCPAYITAPAPTPITSPGKGFDVLITYSDQEVAVRVGQRIEVALAQQYGMTPWGPITVDQPDVLMPVPSGIVAPNGITIAAFVARRAGSVSISSTAGPHCEPNQACPAYAMAFLVYVTVT